MKAAVLGYRAMGTAKRRDFLSNPSKFARVKPALRKPSLKAVPRSKQPIPVAKRG
jgi:hypothetical protein